MRELAPKRRAGGATESPPGLVQAHLRFPSLGGLRKALSRVLVRFSDAPHQRRRVSLGMRKAHPMLSGLFLEEHFRSAYRQRPFDRPRFMVDHFQQHARRTVRIATIFTNFSRSVVSDQCPTFFGKARVRLWLGAEVRAPAWRLPLSGGKQTFVLDVRFFADFVGFAPASGRSRGLRWTSVSDLCLP